MTIREHEKWHGAALQQIVEYARFTAINKSEGDRRSTYLINHNRGLFVKHSSAPPYQFVFGDADQKEIEKLAGRCPGGVWIALVCCMEAEVCLISYDQFRHLAQGRDGCFSITASARPGRSFRVSSGGRRLEGTIPRSAFPKRLFGD